MRNILKELVTIRVAIRRIETRSTKRLAIEGKLILKKAPSASDHESTRENEGRYRITQPRE